MSTVDTIALHGGYNPGNGEPRQVPIYQSTTWKYATSEDMGKLFDLEASGYFYTRLQNPTNDYVAAKLCAMEGGFAGMLTCSGQAANFFAVFNICEAGDHFIASANIYGGTYNLFGLEVLLKLAKEAAAAIKGNDKGRIAALQELCKTTRSQVVIDPMNTPKSDMVDFLRKSSDFALSYDPLITQVAGSIAASQRTARVINTNGVNKEDTTKRIRLSVETIATKDNEKQSGRVAPGTMRGYEFINEYPLIDKTRECCDTAIRMVNAGYAPSAKMPVILGNGFGGVIFHEACGHALEATAVGIKMSYFTDMLGYTNA